MPPAEHEGLNNKGDRGTNMGQPSVVSRITSEKSNKIIQATYRAISAIVRIFCRYLPGETLLSLMQQAVVEEAYRRAHEVQLDGEVSLSQIALLTGFDTRIIKQLRQQPVTMTELDVCSEAAILAHWSQDPTLRERSSNRPIDLPIYGSTGTFQGLVTHYCGRGVSPMLVAQRLEEAGNAKIRNKNWIQFIHADWRWIESSEEDFAEAASHSITSLSSALDQNRPCPTQQQEKWAERRVYSLKIPTGQRDQVTAILNEKVIAHHQEMAALIRSLETTRPIEESQEVIGVGYYFWRDQKKQPK